MLLFLLILNGPLLLRAQQPGCTDPQAVNFDPAAGLNNGSCLYNVAEYTPATVVNPLPDSLHESSGLTFTRGSLWTLNDKGGSPTLYRMDTSGLILQRILLPAAYNNDWEALSSDDSCLYIGDFGNNLSGNRTDLLIWRIPLDSIPEPSSAPVYAVPVASTGQIRFTYSDQPQPPQAAAANQTAFDCEAMVVDHRRIHLFSKNWLSNRTTHYVIAGKTPGNYTAMPQDSLETGFLVSDAARVEGQNCLVLLGYQNSGTGRHFMYILSDYTGDRFFSGNKRLIQLPDATLMGQAEGICFFRGKYGFISNERFSRSIGPITLTVPQQLRRFSLQQWTGDFYSTYRFTGSGAWSDPANWAYQLNPPARLPAGNRVVIQSANGHCLLDQPVGFSPDSFLDLQPAQHLLIPGIWNIQPPR